MQRKLLHLLDVYPPEETQSGRAQKIAKALGTRTPAQVSHPFCIYQCRLEYPDLILTVGCMPVAKTFRKRWC